MPDSSFFANNGRVGPDTYDVTAYNVWLSLGNTGSKTDFLESIRGDRGADGASAAKGDPGPQGDIGPQGPQGEVGPQGDTGPEGPIGPAGVNGQNTPSTITITAATGAAGRSLNNATYQAPNTHITIANATVSFTPTGSETLAEAYVDTLHFGTTSRMEFNYPDGRRYERILEAGVWSDWSQIGLAELTVIDVGTLSAGARTFATMDNPNNLYSFDGTASVNDGWDGTATYSGSMMVQQAGRNLIQYYYEDDANYPFIRYIRGGVPDTFWISTQDQMSPRKVLGVGDSIMAGVGSGDNKKLSFFAVAKFLSRGTDWTNLGVAGAHMSGASAPDATKIAGSFSRIGTSVADLATYDDMLVFYGTNDFNQDTPLGTLGDTTEATFYGSIVAGLTAAWAANPLMRIFLITPGYRGDPATPTNEVFTANGVGVTMSQYRQAIHEVAAQYGVPVVDAYGQLGVNPLNVTSLFTDHIHPNPDGHNRLGRLVAQAIT